jgi:four helix bundle protein
MQAFVAYTNALELVRALVPIIAELKKHSAAQADQLERAASSMVLNIAEGSRRQGKDPRRFYSFANGSASEIRAVLDLAQALGWRLEDARARQLLDRELGLLWGLVHGRRVSMASR